MLPKIRHKNFKIWGAMHVGQIKKQIIRLVLLLLFLIFMHTLAMVYFENLSLVDALWLTLTSVTTVGYGDFSAQTIIGRIATIFLIYLGGIFVLAQAAGLYFDYRQERINRVVQGKWRWAMQDHIVFFHSPKVAGEHYFIQVISQLRKAQSPLAKLPIIIISEGFSSGLSDQLYALNVVHVHASPVSNEALTSASVLSAKIVVLLSREETESISDSINFELTDRLRGMGFKGRIIAEAVNCSNRVRLKKIGADNILRPIRMYPEMLTRSILAPGAEQVIETLFDSHGEECMRFDLKIKTLWKEIIYQLTEHDIGLPIAYYCRDTYQVINHPHPNDVVNVHALYIIVREDNVVKSDYIKQLFQEVSV